MEEVQDSQDRPTGTGLGGSSKLSSVRGGHPLLVDIKDHFTLSSPSSIVRFRSRKNAARVFDNKQSQMVMEETFDPGTLKSEITVRLSNDATFSLQFLRLTYTIVCALWTGFFFVFCLEAILSLVLDFSVASGATQLNAKLNVGECIGVILTIMVFIRGFSAALVIAGHFVLDTWGGHFLAKEFVFKRLSLVVVDWIFFIFFLFVPILVLCITMLMRLHNWWEVTALVWFFCVFTFFTIFAVNVLFYELKAAYDFVQNRHDDDDDSFLQVIKRCILLRQIHSYSGKTKVRFLAKSYFETTEDTEDVAKANIYESTRQEQTGVWSRVTRLSFLSTGPEGTIPLFKHLEKPLRLSTIDDVRDYRPFLTNQTWSLERIFCRPTNSRYITIVSGPGALTADQMRSSLVCSFLGVALMLLFVISILVWFDIGGGFVALVFFACLFVAWNSLSNARRLLQLSEGFIQVQKQVTAELKNYFEQVRINISGDSRDVTASAKAEEVKEEGAKTGDDIEGEGGVKDLRFKSRHSEEYWEKTGTEPSEAVFLVTHFTRFTEATDLFCWLMFGLELGVFFVYPLVTLFYIGNWPIGILFVVVSLISFSRYYVSAWIAIEETGNIDLVGGATEAERWENKSRLIEIVERISKSKARPVWTVLLGICAFGFVAIFLTGVGISTASTFTASYTYLDNFYYPPAQNDMRYPTCSLSHISAGFGKAIGSNNATYVGFGQNATLLDYVWLAGLPYRVENLIQPELNGYFRNLRAIDDPDTVARFRATEDKEGFNSAVNFRLVRFPDLNLALIVIRGTQNNWGMYCNPSPIASGLAIELTLVFSM